MHYKQLLPKGEFIAAAEFGGKTPTLTIASIKQVSFDEEDAGDGRHQSGEKWAVYFKETERGWITNRTNIELLAALFGEETDGWIGRRVTLGADKVWFGREQVDGIRVKGSPELGAPKTVRIKLPRRKAVPYTLQPTPAAKPKPGPKTAADMTPDEIKDILAGEREAAEAGK